MFYLSGYRRPTSKLGANDGCAILTRLSGCANPAASAASRAWKPRTARRAPKTVQNAAMRRSRTTRRTLAISSSWRWSSMRRACCTPTWPASSRSTSSRSWISRSPTRERGAGDRRAVRHSALHRRSSTTAAGATAQFRFGARVLQRDPGGCRARRRRPRWPPRGTASRDRRTALNCTCDIPNRAARPRAL